MLALPLWMWSYQVASGAFVDIGTAITIGGATTAAGNNQVGVTLSTIPALQSVASSVTLRLSLWGAAATGGQVYFNNPSGAAAVDLEVLGAVFETPLVSWSFFGLPGGAGNFGPSPMVPTVMSSFVTCPGL